MAKVLVVDDSLSVRKVVERALVAKQLEVVSAASGNEAIAQIEREQPDLVVCDVVMPDRDGYDICRFVKGHPRLGRVPVLLISGIVNNSVLEQAAEARSDDVLRKPFEAAELVRKVSELLARPGTPHAAPAPVAHGMAAAPPRLAAVPPSPPLAPTPVTTQSVAAVFPRGRDAVEPPAVPARPATAAPAAPREPVAPPPAPAPDLRTALAQLIAQSGADWAALSDREGFLIESAGEMGLETEVGAAMAACLADTSDGIGRELGRGALSGMLIEYEKGTVVLQGVGATAVLAVMLKDAAAIGKVRYYVKRMLPDLARFI
ncbi:MAG TPA: response regulator [Methylomirabilota bacterium]|nr:response regulator [Methylomirabilota bacterium]